MDFWRVLDNLRRMRAYRRTCVRSLLFRESEWVSQGLGVAPIGVVRCWDVRGKSKQCVARNAKEGRGVTLVIGGKGRRIINSKGGNISSHLKEFLKGNIRGIPQAISTAAR